MSGKTHLVAGVLAVAMLAFAPLAASLAEEIIPIPRPSPLHTEAADPGDGIGDPFEAMDGPASGAADPAGQTAPDALLSFESPAAAAPLDLQAPVRRNADGSIAAQDIVLEARLTDEGEPIPEGLTWRVFGNDEGPDGRLPLVAEANGGVVRLSLAPGDYFLHAAYGRAGATKRLTIAAGQQRESVVLHAGGLTLHALVGKDIPLAQGEVSFDIFANDDDEGGERTLVVQNAAPDELVRLNAGTYHIVSTYGDTNSIVRADLEVRAGQLTDATLYHKASRVTLKLVSEPGGEALANTAWSVLTPGGDAVFDSVGAFPTVVLAAGEYTAIAKHDGSIFESTFTVDDAINRDVEVLGR